MAARKKIKKKNLTRKISNWYFLFSLVFVLLGFAIVGRAGYTLVAEGDAWRAQGKKLEKDSVPRAANRGNIYSCDYQLMATSEFRYRLYIDFWSEGIKKDTLEKYLDPLADELHKLLPNKSAAYYRNHIAAGWKARERAINAAKATGSSPRMNREYRLLDEDVNYVQWQKILKMPYFNKGRNRSGLYEKKFARRTKPYGTLASRTIGDVYGDLTRGGSYGLEAEYDSLLCGSPGLVTRSKVKGRYIDVVDVPPVDGKDIISTIDINIQDITEKAVLNKLKEINAESATAIVMEVATGHIKAITNMGKIGPDRWGETQNFAVSDLSEPGSTFKVVSMLVALEDGTVHPNDSVDTGNGVVMLAGHRLTDHNANRGGYGKISAAQSIRYSSNIGVAKLILNAYKDNPGRFVDGIYKLGFHKDMELEIPGYAVPVIRHPSKYGRDWRDSYMTTMSYGYGTQVPPIYTLTFFNAIANKGKMVKPMFVKEICADGKVVERKKTQVINNKMCSDNTLKEIQQMLDDVVNSSDGTGKPARSEKIRTAGKTGTARLSLPSGGYDTSAGSHQVSFCGYFPADNPQYSCIVVMRRPRIGAASGGSMCGTVFKEIAEQVYAHNIIYSQKSFVADTVHPFAPRVKNGLTEISKSALKSLDIDFKDSTAGDWTSTSLRDDRLVLKTRNVADNIVPNVVGMGAKDAVFAMENVGLRVSLSGRGAVSAQSVPAGNTITKGQTVMLTLK